MVTNGGLARDLLVARQRDDEAKAVELQKKEDIGRRRREAEEGFARGIAGMRDENLFETHRWEFAADKVAVVRSLGAVITGDGHGWRLQPRRGGDTSGDLLHLRAGYRSFGASNPRDAILYVKGLEGAGTLVIAKFLLFKANPNARMVDGEFVEGVVPVHRDYIRLGASGDAAERVRRFAEEFHGRLLAGLKAASTP